MPAHSHLRRHWRALAAGSVALAVLVLLTALLGGFRTAADATGTARAGETIEAQPFRLTFEDAVSGRRLAGAEAPSRRTTLVALRGTLASTVAEPIGPGTATDLLAVEGLGPAYDAYGDPSDEPEPDLRVSEGGSLPGVGPGLTYDVSWVYVVDRDRVPEVLDVVVRQHELVVSQLDGEERWLLPEPIVRLRLPVVAEPGGDS